MTSPLLSAEEVTRGSHTNSDKIRALHKAGYDRSQIAHCLNPQCLASVRIDWRAAGPGQVLAEREPLPVEPEAMLPEPVQGNALLGSGFRQLGVWRLEVDGKLGIDARAPDDPGFTFLSRTRRSSMWASLRTAGPPGRVHSGIRRTEDKCPREEAD